MLSCCLSVYCMRNPLIVSLSLYLSLLSFLLFLVISFFLLHFSLALSLPLFSPISVFSSPFAPFFPFLTLCFSDCRLQIATEFHHKSYPTLLLLPLLPPAKHTKICKHTRRLMLTRHQNPQFRVTINKSISLTFGEQGAPSLQRAKKKYLLRRLLHTNEQMHTEQKKEIRNMQISRQCVLSSVLSLQLQLITFPTNTHMHKLIKTQRVVFQNITPVHSYQGQQ